MKLQLVWWGWPLSFGWFRFGDRSGIYRWSLHIGPWELRRWR